MLFLQVAWILYTYGVQGTMNLLMAPEEALGGGLRSASTYLAVSPPPGYGSEVTVLHDAESGLQRTHYTVDGASGGGRTRTAVATVRRWGRVARLWRTGGTPHVAPRHVA